MTLASLSGEVLRATHAASVPRPRASPLGRAAVLVEPGRAAMEQRLSAGLVPALRGLIATAACQPVRVQLRLVNGRLLADVGRENGRSAPALPSPPISKAPRARSGDRRAWQSPVGPGADRPRHPGLGAGRKGCAVRRCGGRAVRRLAIALVAFIPAPAASQGIDGAQAVGLVSRAMQQAGLPAPPMTPPLRMLPSCDHTPQVLPFQGSWAAALLTCDRPIWHRVLRTGASVGQAPVRSQDEGPRIPAR